MSRSIMQRTSIVFSLSALLFVAADWPRFRGPNASGCSEDTGLPVRWSQGENVVWKTALPGFGASSPITLGDQIFLTCYSGYGLSQDAPGRQEGLRHHVLCINRTDGKIKWDRGVKAKLPEYEYDRGFIRLHGYASGTPVTDGEAVYAFFGRSGVYACTLAGKLLWHAEVGSNTHNWGSGTSPILYKNLVIVNASVESGSLVAIDKRSGREAWRAEGIGDSWSTPLVVDVPGGEQELVVSLRTKVFGFEPASGKKLWECDAVQDYVCPAVIAHEGIIYVTGGRKPLTIAIRAGGRGDVTDSHLLWELKKTPKVATPLYHDGLLYWISQRGIATCVKADSGEILYEKRLEIAGSGDKVYASLVRADGKLYGATREDGVIVMAVGPQFEELARNHLDDSIFNATPVISRGQLLIRSDRFLYCIGK